MQLLSHRTTTTIRARLALCLFAALPAAALAQAEVQNKEGVEFFEKRIRPVLALKCYECHSTPLTLFLRMK